MALPARATEDGLLDFMYGKFAAAFIHPPEGGAPAERMMLANPGISLDPADLKTPSYGLSALLDQVPQASRIYHASGVRYSAIYERVLESSIVTRVQVAADQEAALYAKRLIFDKARPGQPTPEYAAFLKYAEAYAAALDAHSLARSEAKAAGKPVPPGLDQAVATARKDWERLGFRAPMEKALAALHKAYEGSSRAMFQTLRADFLKARLRGAHPDNWLPVTANPPVETWTSGTGWMPMTFRQEDLQPPPAEALPAGARPDPKAKAGWSRTTTLAVEVKRVNIARPWMDLGIFSAHTWMLKETTGFALVSTGNPADPDPGPMPVVITGILLARKLTLTGYEGKAPGRLGPFGLGAARRSGSAITAPDPQIIAFFVQVVPKSPTPDPKLFR